MSKKIEDDDGNEVEYYSADEVAAKAKEEADRVAAENQAKIADLEAEKVRLEKLNAERGENFKRYNEMTEEERKNFDANTINLIKRGDELQSKLEEVTKKLTEKEQRELESGKTNALKMYHGGNPELETKVKSQYDILSGMPETTPEEIAARAQAAARLAGISVDSANPLYQPMHGEAPNYQPKKEYTDTPEGKEALDLARQAMGLPTPK